MRRNPDYLHELRSLLTAAPTSSRSQKPEGFMCFVKLPDKRPVNPTSLALLAMLQNLQAGMLAMLWWTCLVSGLGSCSLCLSNLVKL